jgi:hypothetical protein
MTIAGRDALLVGQNFQSARSLTDRLKRWGVRCHFACSVRATSDLLISHSFDLVLSNTYLTNETGYGLLVALAGLPVTAFLFLQVENGCFWLPAIDRGKVCFGLPALRPSEFARALEEMFRRPPIALTTNSSVQEATVEHSSLRTWPLRAMPLSVRAPT